MIYDIEHRIHTLSRNAVYDEAGGHSFSVQDVNFAHWEFSFADGWSQDYWLASSKVDAPNADDAFGKFRTKLSGIIPRVSLVAQCYVESVAQPFLILRQDTDVGWLRYSRVTKGVGLMFMDEERKALDLLISNPEIPDEFYYYWNDIVNSFGYSSKLLLMFSAVESLVRIPDSKGRGGKDWDKLELILGSELKNALWGVPGNSASGLRHRLVHGEHFKSEDLEKDYLILVHKSVVTYFNDFIFRGLVKKWVNGN